MYIFNASNASEYTFITFETTQYAGAELLEIKVEEFLQLQVL